MLLLCISLSVIFVLYYYLTMNYNYWKKKKVPYPEPQLFFGNVKDIIFFTTSFGRRIKEIYDQFEGHPYVGIYELRTPALLLRDPKLVKLIMIKDFNYFSDRGIVFNEDVDPLGAHLINLSGARWRSLRTKMTPTFTAVKMKSLFPFFLDISMKFKHYLKQYADVEGTVEFRNLTSKFTTEVIGTCCFGLELDAIQDQDSEFRIMTKKVLDSSGLIQLKRFVRSYMPSLFKALKIVMNPEDVTNYFMKLVKDMIEYRVNNGIMKNDFLQLLIELKGAEKISNGNVSNGNGYTGEAEDIVIDDKLITAQAYIFFLAGLETSSSTMSFALYELAVNPDIQEKVYEEIRDVLKKHGSLTYEAINEMKYLDCVVRETLRKHSPTGVTVRVCNQDYQIPGHDLVIEKGTKVLIPIEGIHHDPTIYENPETFNPDRFMEENKKSREQCAYLPFGEGPRICIGMRFAYLQTKVGLVTYLLDYKIVPSPITSDPLEYDPVANILTSVSGLYLIIRHRNQQG